MNHYQIEALIIAKAEAMLHEPVLTIEKMTKGAVNTTYKLTAASGDYVFRLFPSKSWPEEGKIEFIHRNLAARDICRAEMLAFVCDDVDFPNRFMLERFIHGQNGEDYRHSGVDMGDYYIHLARLVSQLHEIEMPQYGWIGHGNGTHGNFTDFATDMFSGDRKKILERNIMAADELDAIKDTILHSLSLYNLPPVLNHGDISPDNTMMVDNRTDSLLLIDWDNATSGTWAADFSIMTYWMRMDLNQADYQRYRGIFLRHYQTKHPVDSLEHYERTIHLFEGIQLLSFYKDERLIHSTLEHVRHDHAMLRASN